MAIQAQLADGRVLEFPDGTEPAVIQQTVKRMLAQEQTQQPEAQEQSLFERFKEFSAGGPDISQVAREKILKPAAAITSGAIAEPIAGAAGIGAMLRGAGPEVAEEEIKQTREALTFRPETAEAKETLATIGGVLEPVGEKLQEVRKTTGDLAFKLTGSPAFASIATALPDATIEALGFGLGRKFAQVKTGLKRTPDKAVAPGKAGERAVTKSLLESAPEVDQIKDASRAIYKEIDDLNVQTKPQATQMLVNKIVKRAQKENVDEILTPKSARVVEQFKAELDDIGPRSVSDLDRLRKRAQIAAQSTDPADARVGAILVDEIDSFMDDLPQQAFVSRKAKNIKGTFKEFNDPATGITFREGQPATFNYVRNPQKAPKAQGFQQNIEPAGKYMTPSSGKYPAPEGFEAGSITMDSPLVIKWNTKAGGGYDSTGWKKILSDAFGGATGKELSQKIVDAGYDGIVTVDVRPGGRSTTSEIVDLSRFKAKGFTPIKPVSVKPQDISNRYKAARSLWGRARRAELISEAFDKAGRQASGFENGVRTQFRSILNNKKRSRFFTKDELAAMDDVVKGTTNANIMKLVGRLGFSEGAATNILGGLGGAAVLGPAAPVIGQISRKFAQKTTEAAAKNMESLVRSGAQGRKIATAYMQSVPKAKRSVQELSDLLISSGSEVDDLLTNANKLVKEAAEITRARKTFQRAEALGAAAPAALPTEEQ